jgi:hypothetical protein
MLIIITTLIVVIIKIQIHCIQYMSSDISQHQELNVLS